LGEEIRAEAALYFAATCCKHLSCPEADFDAADGLKYPSPVASTDSPMDIKKEETIEQDESVVTEFLTEDLERHVERHQHSVELLLVIKYTICYYGKYQKLSRTTMQSNNNCNLFQSLFWPIALWHI